MRKEDVFRKLSDDELKAFHGYFEVEGEFLDEFIKKVKPQKLSVKNENNLFKKEHKESVDKYCDSIILSDDSVKEVKKNLYMSYLKYKRKEIKEIFETL
jgi:hypothetical protein